nr:GxxExxY protein [Oceanococcus sp. HetDA_MAG_MS8]
MSKPHKDWQTHAVIGAAMEVHRQLGGGLLERVYQQALAVECEMRDIPFRTEVPLRVHYKGRPLPAQYRADLLCFGRVIVECKAKQAILAEHIAQALHYLHLTRMPIALVLNFGTRSLEWQRVVLSSQR